MPSRRSVLVGLGGLVAGGGALIGTGAFSTVEAERTVSVQTEGDADALLGLAPADGENDEGVVQTNGDGLIQINFDGNDGDGGGDGLNQRARTRFNNLVTITNQGTQTVNSIQLGFPETDFESGDLDTSNLNFSDTFSFLVSDGSDADDFDGTGDTVSPGEDGASTEIMTGNNDVPSTLTPGDTVTFGLEIDLIDGGINEDLPNGDYTLTIEASESDSS